MYKNRATTNAGLMIFRVTPPIGAEKIVHISHCSRLFKLADFIFYIYKTNQNNSDFEFFYLDKESKAYGDYTLFKLKKEDTPLPPHVGNIRNARIDSAIFNRSMCIALRITEKPQEEYVIQYLQFADQKRGRKYPFVEPDKNNKLYPPPSRNMLFG